MFIKPVSRRSKEKRLRWLQKAKPSEKNVKIMVELAAQDNDSQVEEGAYEQLIKYAQDIKVMKYLGAIANNRKNYIFGYSAVAINLLNDEQILAGVLKKFEPMDYGYSDAEYKACIKAMDKIKNQSLLIEIYNQGVDCDIRNEVLSKITDQQFLLNLFEKDMHLSLDLNVVKKITDKKVLEKINNTIEKIALEDKDSYRKECAILRISDNNTLLHIVKNETDDRLRAKAKLRISDPILKKEAIAIINERKEAKLEDEIDNIDWYDIITTNTNLSRPDIGELRWSYGDSQNEIIAIYKEWKLSGKMDQNMFVSLEITHREREFKKTISDHHLSEFLYKIF